MIQQVTIALLSVVFSTHCFASSSVSQMVQEAMKPQTTDIVPKIQLSVEEAWARSSSPPNNNSAAYMTLKNDSNTNYEIVAATSVNVANTVELHQTFDDKGISRMAAVDKLVVPAHSTLQLKPGGIHIMLLNLKAPLNPGDQFKIILHLKDGRTYPVPVEVKAIGSQ